MKRNTIIGLGVVTAIGVYLYYNEKNKQSTVTTKTIVAAPIPPPLTPNQITANKSLKGFDIVFSHAHPTPEAVIIGEEIRLSRYAVNPNKIHKPLYL